MGFVIVLVVLKLLFLLFEGLGGGGLHFGCYNFWVFFRTFNALLNLFCQSDGLCTLSFLKSLRDFWMGNQNLLLFGYLFVLGILFMLFVHFSLTELLGEIILVGILTLLWLIFVVKGLPSISLILFRFILIRQFTMHLFFISFKIRFPLRISRLLKLVLNTYHRMMTLLFGFLILLRFCATIFITKKIRKWIFLWLIALLLLYLCLFLSIFLLFHCLFQ